MSWRGFEKRVKSPTSVTSTTALISAIPRIACKLAERGLRGATVSDIQSAAETDVEKLASFSGIRFALAVGRKEHHYRNKNGKWFLTGNKTVEFGAKPKTPPSQEFLRASRDSP